MNTIGKDESIMKHSVIRFVKGASVGLVASALLQPL
jgi:hypothetical protein